MELLRGEDGSFRGGSGIRKIHRSREREDKSETDGERESVKLGEINVRGREGRERERESYKEEDPWRNIFQID